MSRIYKVDLSTSEFVAPYLGNGATETPPRYFLVDAVSPKQAIAHVAKKFASAAIAKPRDIVELMSGGLKVEHAEDQS